MEEYEEAILFDEKEQRKDKRGRVGNDLIYSHPHHCIGLLSVNRAGSLPVIGTAFLIAKDLILTAAHNFKDRDKRITEFESI